MEHCVHRSYTVPFCTLLVNPYSPAAKAQLNRQGLFNTDSRPPTVHLLDTCRTVLDSC